MQFDAPILSAIASPRRREILRLIWDDEMSAGKIHQAMQDVTFGAVSLQLKALADAGVVQARAEGRHRFYRADRQALSAVRALLENMWSDALWQLKLQAELEHARRGPRPRPARTRRPRSTTRAHRR